MMNSQRDNKILPSSSFARWLAARSTPIAMTICLFLGYLAGILSSASHLTLLNFLAYTIVTILYGCVGLILSRLPEKSPWRLPCAIFLTLLTGASGFLALTGLWFNWLLYFVTVALYFTYLPISSASIFFVLLYLLVIANSYILHGEQMTSGQDQMTLLAGFVFTAAFSLSNRFLHFEQERSQQLFHQLETSNRELEQAHSQLRAYADEVEELTVARERTRMAREIHDTLGHYLTIITIQLETISKLIIRRDPDSALHEVEEARKVAAQSMQEVRNAVSALRPTNVTQFQPLQALTALGDEFRQVVPDIDLVLDLDTVLPELTLETQHALYRIVQEALTNIRKHAHATKVLVRLRCEDNTVELLIRDNGDGTPANKQENAVEGFGLLGLRERMELLGGQVTFGPIEPHGYNVLARLPHPQLSSPTTTTTE